MTETRNSSPVAVLGTGLIGAAVARNLARKGFQTRAWNRSLEKARPLAVDGVDIHEHPADAVRDAGTIVTVLKDGAAVKEAMGAALPAIRKGAVWLQLSTVGHEAIDALAEWARNNGMVFYDAPVQGTRQPAEQGRLLILACGPQERRETAQSVFDAIGQRTLWLSGEAGASSRLKLALNSYVFALTHGIAETLAIAKALGVDPALAVEAVTGGPLDSGYFQAKAAAMLQGDYSTSFSVTNAVKDAQLVADALAQAGVKAEIAQASLARFQRTLDAGHGDKDIAASYIA